MPELHCNYHITYDNVAVFALVRDVFLLSSIYTHGHNRSCADFAIPIIIDCDMPMKTCTTIACTRSKHDRK